MVADSPKSILDELDGEVALFKALAIARPVGQHRHFHLLAIQNSIYNDTGRTVSAKDVLLKLETFYNLESLEAIEQDAEAYDGLRPGEDPPRTPSPSQNLNMHPFFRDEYTLPDEEAYETIIAQRRVRNTPSPPSSPEPAPPSKRIRKRGRKPDKAELAGLVAGDSDSSALTQESGDEGVGTPRDSVITATDAGEEEEEDMDVDEPSAVATSPRPGRGRPRGKRGTVGRGRGGTTRGTKKPRKR